MAVRFDASTDSYSATTTWALGAQANFSMCCWVKITVDTNTFANIMSTDGDATSGSGIFLTFSGDGTSLSVYDEGTSVETPSGLNATVGTWYFVGLAVAGTAGTIYHKAAGAAALTTIAVTTAATHAVNRFFLGNDQYSEWLNGCVCAAKHWTAQLSTAEMEIEASHYMPARFANLTAWYPLVQTDTADYGGSARTLTVGGTLATEDGPPLPWGAMVPIQLGVSATAAGPPAAPAPVAVQAAGPWPGF